MVQSDFASDFSGKGALRNVSDLARRDKIDLPKTFYPALVQMATYKGSVNGLPQLSAGDSPYLFLSKEVAESAGVDAGKPPASWDELVSAAQKMTKRGAGGGGFDRIGFGFPESTFQSWMVRNNGKMLSDDATKVQFNSQEGQDTLQWMYSQMTGAFGNWENRQAFYASVASSAPAGGRVAWYTNKVGMWTTGVWHFFEIKGEAPTYNPQFQYGVGLVPHEHQERPGQAGLPGRVRLALLHPRRLQAGRRRLGVDEAHHHGRGQPPLRQGPEPAQPGDQDQRGPGLLQGQPALEHGGQAGPGDHGAPPPDPGLAPHRPRPGEDDHGRDDRRQGAPGGAGRRRPRGADPAGRGAALGSTSIRPAKVDQQEALVSSAPCAWGSSAPGSWPA